MKKTFYLFYAVICYLIFFATFLYLAGFVENLLVPKSIDTPKDTEDLTFYLSMLVNIGLISLFGLQHSVMARPAFKKKIKKIIPEPAERSTYVLMASIMLIILFYFWQPQSFIIWSVTSETATMILTGVSFLGWGLVLLSTFLINHFHLFGLHQAWFYKPGKEQPPIRFRTPFLYKIVRHPLYLGFLIAFWAAPVMTAGHLLFSLAMTVYIFIGMYHEEKDLTDMYGPTYERYQGRTARILPFVKL